MILITFKDEETFIKESIKYIKKICRGHSKTIRIALSGGSIHALIYKALAYSKNIPFERIEFFQVNERYVQKDNPNSNYRMIYENLIKPVGKRLKSFYYFDTSQPIDKAVKQYALKLKKIEACNPFDLTILGIGNDGQIASIYPHSEAFKERKKLAFYTNPTQYAGSEELTITLPVILASKKILLLIKDGGKEKILDTLLNSLKPIEEFPAKALLKHKNFSIYFYNP